MRLLHRLDRAVAVRRRIGDAIAAQGISVAGKLGVNFRAAFHGGIPIFQNQKSRAFAEDKTVARQIERTARALRRFVVRRKRAEQAKTGQADGIEHRIVAADEHEIAQAAPHGLERGADGLTAGSARGVNGCGVAANPKMMREQSERGVRLAAAKRDRVGGKIPDSSSPSELNSPSGAQNLWTFFSSSKVKPIMPAPTLKPQRSAVEFSGRMPASANASSAAANANRCEREANLSSLRSADGGFRVEIFHLRADACGETAGVEILNRPRIRCARRARLAQVDGASLPTGVTMPMPVMAILRRGFMNFLPASISRAKCR